MARRISLPDQFDLGGLVLLTANSLDFALEYDPALFKGPGGTTSVTVRGVHDLSPDQLWTLTNQILAARGLTFVRSPGASVLSIVKLTDAAGAAGLNPDLAEAGLRTGFVHEIVRPRFRTAKELAENIKPILTKGAGSATPVGDSGLLLISDLVPRVEEAKAFLAQLDVPRADIVPTVLEARNIPPSALVAAVTQVAGKRDAVSGDKLKGELLVAPDGRSLLLLAPAETQAAWLSLIQALDQREEMLTREYTPKVFSAKEVANLIEQTVRDRAAAPGAASGGSSGISGGNSPEDRFRIVTDDLTGTLIVTATPTQHEKIQMLLDRLDSTPQSAARPVRAFAIRNRPVKEVLATLQQLISAGALENGPIDSGASSPGALRDAGSQRSVRADAPSEGSILPALVPPPAAVATAPAPAAQLGRPQTMNPAGVRGIRATGAFTALSLTADEGTNTLIAIAEPRLLAQLELLIRQLDVRQPQVMLEVFLVSLSEQDAMNLGVELEKLGTVGGSLYQLSSLFGLSTGTGANRVANASQGFTGAVLNPGDFNAVVRALETISSGSTKSLPRVLVNNNQQAVFNSVLQQPYTISNTTSGAGTTTSFGGTQDAGTTIAVKPQIAEADQLVLEYSLSLSSFVGAPPASGLPPPRQQNNISSNATIPDGHTVVVGGIELVSDGRNTRQVPYVGDVPLVGELFKVRDNSNSRQRFYVFIRAAVLRDQQLNDLKYLTDATIRRNGLGTMGISDGFPMLKPRVIR
ncbi:MAG: secretin N-terminal domain-containing protein [Phycisphaerales bacterium]|nr:hypothetical protein [Planctomycetota bacterium]